MLRVDACGRRRASADFKHEALLMGYIYLYMGTGAGKTTNALGLALRAVGHRQKAVIIQFMKARRSTGEVKAARMLKPCYEIYQVGRPGWIDFKHPDPADIAAVARGMELAKRVLKAKPNILVLDELALAAWGKLISTKAVLDLLDEAPKKTHIIITGRYAPQELLRRADYVNEIREIRYPKKMVAVKGINW
ncbi:MAG: cob(I)yrinic acid a,c-diamide adenosyltransferase [Candidatus Aenigmatarchaeota archaeon]